MGWRRLEKALMAGERRGTRSLVVEPQFREEVERENSWTTEEREGKGKTRGKRKCNRGSESEPDARLGRPVGSAGMALRATPITEELRIE
jgi:hypothetical protein